LSARITFALSGISRGLPLLGVPMIPRATACRTISRPTTRSVWVSENRKAGGLVPSKSTSSEIEY
jgi:hypothetical protein